MRVEIRPAPESVFIGTITAIKPNGTSVTYTVDTTGNDGVVVEDTEDGFFANGL